MKDGKPQDDRETPRRRLSDRGGGQRRTRGYVERATAQGHSGRGSESVLPHLRDQLRLKALLPSPFPTPDEEKPGKDQHHQ
ncbi:hypothetical protein HHL11_14680 [Ramlibacter sp. G-1-2-2]|uniref:Uncharacterized protein n=1 Tax=Ramlibacter agri TaxID=2728837 RepID=A0A848H656_9BURK|nr:hypothetical protein [Ramlibacter agri]NML45001.1 hypothetical protein [Ramlibacter agri]